MRLSSVDDALDIMASGIPNDHTLGERVTELVRDNARHHCIRFFETVEEADRWLLNN
ncbi:MAG: hypothetical protein PVH88_16965 [Ignavibacteria bacterium]